MPENELIFQTEEERQKALLNLQEDNALGLPVSQDQIDAIMSAKIAGESEANDEDGATTPDKTEATETADDKEAAQQADSEAAAQANTDPWRFELSDQDIPTETFLDKGMGETRPIWSFKKGDPDFGKKLVKTLVHGQTRIHQLESDVLAAHAEGEKKAAQRLQSQLDEARKEAEDLKKKLAEAPTTSPEPTVSHETTQVNKPSIDLATALENLSKLPSQDSDEYSITDHNNALTAVVTAQAYEQQQVSQALKIQREETERVKTETEAEKAARLANEEKEKTKLAAQTAAENAGRAWQEACKEMDQFISARKMDLPGFDKMTAQADSFHAELARTHFGLNAWDNPTDAQKEQAATQYLRETPALMTKLEEKGTQEPSTYKAWVELDQIDAMKHGLFLNPTTKQWEKRANVSYGSVEDAALIYERDTGKLEDRIRQEKIDSSRKVVKQLNTRDNSLVQMDTSKGHAGAEATLISEEEAGKILESMDTDRIMSDIQRGEFANFDMFNKARVKLGMPPIHESDYGVTRPAMKMA